MPAKNKTIATPEPVEGFIDRVAESEDKKADSYTLLRLMEKVSGHKGCMWGPSIIGFGQYHYKYESGHEGDAPLIGFSPRKTAIALYVFTGLKHHEDLLEKLGRFKRGKACLYVRKLSDIDMAQLERLMRATINHLKQAYG